MKDFYRDILSTGASTNAKSQEEVTLDEYFNNLTSQLETGPASVRVHAARELGTVAFPAQKPVAVRALVRAVAQDDALAVRSEAALSLGRIGEPRAIQPVVRALSQSQLDTDIAVEALQVFGDRAFRSLATAHGESPHHQGLIRAGVNFSDQQLRRGLQWRDPKARAYAAAVWNYRPHRDVLPALSELLLDPIESVRQAALYSLDEADLDHVMPMVLDHLTYPDYRVRVSAVWAFDALTERYRSYQISTELIPDWEIKKDTLASSLAEMIQDPIEPDGYLAATALVQLRSTEVTNEIVRLLNADNAQVRAAMAEAIRDGVGETNTNQPNSWIQIGRHEDGHLQIDRQTEQVAQELVNLADNDKHAAIRELALEALHKFDEKINEAEQGWSPPVQPETVEVPHPQEITESIDMALQPDAPITPRYADATIYDRGKQKQHRVPDSAPLVEGRWYFLEVAVRVSAEGLGVQEGKRRAVRELHKAEPVRLLVTMQADGFDLQDPVQELILLTEGDSVDNAWFQVRPQRRSLSSDDLAQIRVSVFYRCTLIEVFTVKSEVVGKLDDQAESRFTRAKPKWLVHELLQRAYSDFDDLIARGMHIEVRRLDTFYQLTFTLEIEQGPDLALTASTQWKATDLEDKLERFRKAFERLATSDSYLNKLKGRQGEFDDALHGLAKIGRDLWTSLYSAKPGSSLDVIGRRLEEEPLPDGSMIQVTVQQEAADFLFPWSLLYDRHVPDAAYKTEEDGFWGMRYPIEQRVANIRTESDASHEVQDSLRMMFMLWEGFRNEKSQIAMMDAFKDRAGAKLEISEPPVTKKNDFYDSIAEEAHILYFYTHGHTRRALDSTDDAAWRKAWAERYETFPEEARQKYEPLNDAITHNQYEADRSWIKLSKGTLYLDEMRDRIRFLPGRPLAILNMCESAQVIPTLAESFVEFFLNHNACTVIGTECPMTVAFAHPFAQRLLEGMLSGRRVGDVLVDARRHFVINERNPLGLAYTLFGSAAAMFVPPRLPQQSHIQNEEESDE